MHIIRKPGWALPEHMATPEHLFWNRRAILAGMAGAGALALGAGLPSGARAQDGAADPSASLYPVKRNEAYTLDRALSQEKHVTSFNNFYEFGTSKSIARAAQSLPIRPWTVTIDGMVDKPQQIGIDDLLKAMPLEERLYRFRCVEAWSMAVPWSGFALSELVKLASPQAGAKYLRFETFQDASIAPGQNMVWYPWPYVEGVTMAEATNELAFMVTGVYGKPLPKQNGAPLRLALPWKYGFKSIKSIVRITFTDERPKTMWEALGPTEYGFWANVNPDVAHPRWSQAQEDVLGTGQTVPTLLYNGYAEQVAGLYKGMEGEKLFM
ncbi:protein-methionine-sulfoxide reductase catalytic subunit MsrP [Pannonibacter indicus]|jgi:sulfoxide reductase catalytic subunit YedY|uniref:Protein-methionine-sulfoxide reductase catalytic subunit MsrP n=1 Tax=Pannonibacter indicus TaxID=466044 RepID=A0A0K6HMV7_9HYPH|nr:protein-methionine-sulfoxide reductase catalytic subunit MsrP [Pannonibacter indicus]CUA92113.1 Periplasmic DMSO/TMAO reductase YedYZ, molybdopterin-dependent catalytic subunit [Pannonibacter indicus]